MAGPWEKYQSQQPEQPTGPWTKYQTNQPQSWETGTALENFPEQDQTQPEQSTYDKYIAPHQDLINKIPSGFPGVDLLDRAFPSLKEARGKILADLAAGAVKGAGELNQNLGKILPGINIAKQTVAALTPQASDENIQSKLEQSYTPSSKGVEYFGRVAGPTFLGGLGGAQVATKMGLDAFPIIRAAIGGLGAGVGEGVSKEPGTGRMIIGEQAALPLTKGLPETSKAATMANDILDASLLAFGGEMALKPIVGLANFFWQEIGRHAVMPFRGQEGIKNVLRDQFVNDFVDKSHVIDYAKTPQERAKALHDLGNSIKEFSETTIQNGTNQINIKRPTAIALSEHARQNELRNTDLIQNEAAKLQKGFLAGTKGTTAQTEALINRPYQATSKFLGEQEDLLGGKQAAVQAEEGVRKQAASQIEPFEQSVARTEAELKSTNEGLMATIRSNPMLGQKLDLLNKAGVDINTQAGKNATIDNIRHVVTSAFNIMEKQKQILLDRIPSTAGIDTNQLIVNLDLDKSILSNLEKAEGNYKKVYQVIPLLNKKISAGFKASTDVEDLITLRDRINQAAPAQEFRKWYSDTWAPIWKDGHLERFVNEHQATISRGPGFGVTNFRANTNDLLSEIVKNPERAQHLNELLKLPEAGRNQSLITDVALHEVAGNIQSELNAGKTLADIDIKSLTKPLEEYGPTLAKTDPEGLMRINQFLTTFKGAKTDIAKLKDQLKYATEVREKNIPIIKQRYKEFFSTDESTGVTGFKQIFNKPGNNQRLNEILDEGDTAIKSGMKSAFIRNFRDEMFSGTKQTQGGETAFNIKKWDDILKENSDLMKYGNTVFKDTPETMQVLEALSNETARMQEALNVGKGEMPFNFPVWARDASTAWDKVITITFGVLNRWAARARAVKGAMVRALDPKELAEQVADGLMDAGEFAKALHESANKLENKWGQHVAQAARQLILISLKDRIGNNVKLDDLIKEELDSIMNRNKTDKQTEDMLNEKTNSKK